MQASTARTSRKGSAPSRNYCPGDVTASADLSHFVFATEWNVFAPGGKLAPPGSVYDNDIGDSTVKVASKTPRGENIPSEPTDHAGDPLQIPAVSERRLPHPDGRRRHRALRVRRLLRRRPAAATTSTVRRCPMQPSHLYMRVDGAVTYDVSQGHDVNYVGMTADGTKVYFTSERTADTGRHRHAARTSTCGERGRRDSLTLISKADNSGTRRTGNSDACNADFVHASAASSPTTQLVLLPALDSGLGGNCLSDNFIASENGDIYFFSPEQLDGTRGVPNQENLYVYRDGTGPVRHHPDRRPVLLRSLHVGDMLRDGIAADAGLAGRQPHGVRHRQPGHPVRQRRPPRDVHLRHRTRGSSSASPASRAANRRPPTSQASQDGLFMTERRPHLLHHRRRARPRRHQPRPGRLRVRRRPAAADHARAPATPATPGRRLRRHLATSRAWSGSAPTAPTSTSRPTTRWSARTTTASSSSSTTPAPAAASRLRRRRRPAPPPTSATALGSPPPPALAGRHRRRARRSAATSPAKHGEAAEEAPQEAARARQARQAEGRRDRLTRRRAGR